MRPFNSTFVKQNNAHIPPPTESHDLNESQLQIIKWHSEICTLIKIANLSENPTLQWELSFIKFLSTHCISYPILSKFDISKLPFALCLGGTYASGTATPYCALNIIVILKNENGFGVMDKFLAELIKNLSRIADYDKSKLFNIPSHIVNAQYLCGTKEQLFQQLGKIEGNAWIKQALSAIVIAGDNRLLHEFQSNLMKQRIYRNNKLYHHVSCFLYDEATKDCHRILNKDQIDIYEDIIEPIFLILYGLKNEFNLSTSVIIYDLISSLKDKGHITADIEILFTRILIDAGKLRWRIHIDIKSAVDTLKIADKYKKEIGELINIVSILREEASKRIKKRENSVQASDKFSRCMNIDKQNLTDLPKKASARSSRMNIFDTTDEMKKYFHAHRTYFKLDLTGSTEALASRLFNNVSTPEHFAGYIDCFFLCIHKGNIDKNKFYNWLWAAIRRCSHDIFDSEGKIKPDLAKYINQDNWYDLASKQIGREKLNKYILFSYFMNALFAGIVNEPRYIEKNEDSLLNGAEHPLLFQAQIYINDFFNTHIYSQTVLRKIQEANYYTALVEVMACLDALSVKLKNVINKNINKAEKALYQKYLGDEQNINSIHGILFSINKLLTNRNHKKDESISREEFHDYDTKIIHLLENFQKEMSNLLIEIKSSWSHRLFSVFNEGLEIEKIDSFVKKTRTQLVFFAQDTVNKPDSSTEKCVVS